MSKTVKNWMMRDYQSRLDGVENAVVVSLRGVPANDNNRLRLGLSEKSIRITVVRNNLARRAFQDTPLSGISPLLDGPSALAYGGESVVDVARELVRWSKDIDNLEVKGGLLEGALFEGEAGVEALSNYPTRSEAIGNIVGLGLSSGQKLVSQARSPGSNLMGIVKTIQEKLEKGETIEKAA